MRGGRNAPETAAKAFRSCLQTGQKANAGGAFATPALFQLRINGQWAAIGPEGLTARNPSRYLARGTSPGADWRWWSSRRNGRRLLETADGRR